MRSYLKENEIRIKNGTDVNAVMREMMSVILDSRRMKFVLKMEQT